MTTCSIFRFCANSLIFFIRGKKRGNKLEEVVLAAFWSSRCELESYCLYWVNRFPGFQYHCTTGPGPSVLLYYRSLVPAFSPQTERGISSGQGARGPADARIMSAPRALAFAAEELLQELVEEHRDTAIEFRSLTDSAPRRGRWVGGDTPIEDAKTKKRFRMLDPWCAQVRLR